MNRLRTASATLATSGLALLVAPALARAEETVDPTAEFGLHRLFGPDLDFGWADFSISKAVVYLWLAAALAVLSGVLISRKLRLRPSRTQAAAEGVYTFAQESIARATLGPKVFNRYMPYVASIFVLLWFVNLISFLPLPFGNEQWHGIPLFSLYAATSNINVTLALTVVTFVATHYEGIRNNGAGKYFASWAPEGNIFLKAFVWPLHALSELLRLVSLSVRLFANMLAGHLLILMMLLLISVIGSVFVAIGTVPIAIAFFMFEFGLIASLQAFIFALLSGIYIGLAAEPSH